MRVECAPFAKIRKACDMRGIQLETILF